jgi:hypothetical protein
MSICCICGTDFVARHSYGLCSSCFTRDAARELDRVETALHKARRSGVAATLTLKEWLSAISDFKGLCGYCQEYTYSIIEMVELSKGLTYDNVVPSCKACSTRRREGYGTAEHRVKQYLSTERTPQDIAQNEEP